MKLTALEYHCQPSLRVVNNGFLVVSFSTATPPNRHYLYNDIYADLLWYCTIYIYWYSNTYVCHGIVGGFGHYFSLLTLQFNEFCVEIRQLILSYNTILWGVKYIVNVTLSDPYRPTLSPIGSFLGSLPIAVGTQGEGVGVKISDKSSPPTFSLLSMPLLPTYCQF